MDFPDLKDDEAVKDFLGEFSIRSATLGATLLRALCRHVASRIHDELSTRVHVGGEWYEEYDAAVMAVLGSEA